MAKITSFHRVKYDLQTSFNPLVKLMTLSLSKILVIKMLTFTSDDDTHDNVGDRGLQKQIV